MQTDLSSPPIPDHKSEVSNVLGRPASERLREYKYRFAQSVVFGLPVVALHFFGPALGGPEAARWVGLLQLLLAGWVMYVGGAGMLVDAMLRRKLTADGVVAGTAIALFLAGGAAVIHVFLSAHAWSVRPFFPSAVLLLCVWTGIQWYRHRKAT
jgi:cation transport ATPase